MITLVNATASTIPVAEVGVGGYFCQLIGLKPGARSRCRLRVRGDSPVLFRVGTTGGCFPVWIDAPREEVPVLVTQLILPDQTLPLASFQDQFGVSDEELGRWMRSAVDGALDAALAR